VGHTVPVHETVDLAWFCISAACGGEATPSALVTSKTSTTTSSSPATISSGGSIGGGGSGTISEWSQW
jgi:hypothetical protein